MKNANLSYALRAEARAMGKPHLAWLNDDGSIRVRCSDGRCFDSNPWHNVTFKMLVDGTIQFKCNCRGGVFPRDLCPCWHAALAARRLIRHKLAERTETGYKVPDAYLEAVQASAMADQPDDPFEGLPR